MSRTSWRLPALLVLLWCVGPVAAQPSLIPAPLPLLPPPSPLPVPPLPSPPLLPMASLAAPPLYGVVFAVDGSACLHDMTPDLRRLLASSDVALGLHPFRWSHGTGRVFADLRGSSHHQAKAQELAKIVLIYRQQNPANRIVLVAHSAGAAIVLSAAETLPAGCLDRIILLAPAVSYRYDLRPALRCARDGIDVFYSGKDVISHALTVTGTVDGWNGYSAGGAGFAALQTEEYGRLRQYAWTSEMYAHGYWGGHFGCTHPDFLRQYVLPLLIEGDARLQPPVTTNADGTLHTVRSAPPRNPVAAPFTPGAMRIP